MIRFEPFERRTLLGRRYFFRIVRDGNNEIIAPSQAYKHPANRDFAMSLIKRNAADAPIVEGKR